VIQTNKPVVRDDRHDLVYKTRREKYNAIMEETKRLHDLGYPVLVGTVNVDVSETLSRMFKRAGLATQVLNAKWHQHEAEIVALAGQAGTITIATNMAGRGTDIKLGPGVTESKPSVVKDEENKPVDVIECGGLHIIGSERHESRRIDRQLRGRAGRQGDPGASQFFLSLEDDLMRLFGSERIAKLMDHMGAQEGEMLTHPLITRSIEQAQKRVELQNFQSRKRLLEYDDVMNQQREVIYSLRTFALEGGEELKGEALRMIEKAVSHRVETALADYDAETDVDLGIIRQELLMHYLITVPALEGELRPASLADAVRDTVDAGRLAFTNKMASLEQFADQLLSLVMLQVLDEKWKDHLYDLDQLRAGITYRSWGQKDPLIEYKQEAYNMFVDLMADIYNTFTERFLRAQIVFQPPAPPPPQQQHKRDAQRGPAKRYNALGVLEDVPAEEKTPPQSAPEAVDSGPAESPPSGKVKARPDPVAAGAGGAGWSNVGRNDPCPCGSGKKFKKCHGIAA
jgi:preprotein translocase subunit SecA